METRNLLLYGFLLLLAVALTGCTSYEDDYISKYCPGSCTVLTGRVTTADGTKPMKGVILTATWKDLYYLSGGTIRKKAVARTDEDGNYTMRFLLRDDELQAGYISIETSVEEGKFLDCQSDDTLLEAELRRDTTIIRNYYYPQKALLSLELANRQDMRPEDRMTTSVTFGIGIDDKRGCGYHLAWGNMGEFRQTVAVAAETQVLLTTTKTKAGLTTNQTDTLYLALGERKTHNLIF